MTALPPTSGLTATQGTRDVRAQGVVCRRQQSDAEARGGGEGGGDLRERLAAVERLGANEMHTEVAVAELEPRLAAEPPHLVERVPRLVLAAPPSLLVREPGEGVEDAVQVRRDVEAPDLEIVADVPDHRHVGRVDDLNQPAEEAGAADSSRQDNDPCHDRGH